MGSLELIENCQVSSSSRLQEQFSHLTIFHVTSVLYEKLACQFLNKFHIKNCHLTSNWPHIHEQNKIFIEKLLVESRLYSFAVWEAVAKSTQHVKRWEISGPSPIREAHIKTTLHPVINFHVLCGEVRRSEQSVLRQKMSKVRPQLVDIVVKIDARKNKFIPSEKFPRFYSI